MTTVTLTTGYTVETGCYVDGHWGIYSIDHMMDQCASLVGFDTTHYLAADNDDMAGCDDGCRAETRREMADELENALNAATPKGFLWHWSGGEFFLSPFCGGEEECDDETCACHS